MASIHRNSIYNEPPRLHYPLPPVEKCLLPDKGNSGTVNLGLFMHQVAFVTMANSPDALPTELSHNVFKDPLSALSETGIDRVKNGQWKPVDCGDLRDLEINCHGGMGLCYPYYKKSLRRWGALEVTLHLEGHINNVVAALCVPAGVRVNVGLEVSSMQVDLCARLLGDPSSYWAIELKSLLCALWPGWNGLDDAAINRKIFGSFKQHGAQLSEKGKNTQPRKGVSAIGVAPARLRGVWWDFDSRTAVLGPEDLAPVPNNAMDILSFDRWLAFIEDLIFHIFAFIVDVQPLFKAFYERKCPIAVARAVQMYANAREALKPGRWEIYAASLMRTTITGWQHLSMTAFSILPLPMALRCVRTVSTQRGWEGLPFEVDASLWRPLALCDTTMTSKRGGTGTVFIFKDMAMVWKVYRPGDLLKFENELKVYSKCVSLQGKCIPRVLGTGRLLDSDARVLITTYAGTPHPDLEFDDELRDQIFEAVVAPLHAAGYHHHDVWERNILRDAQGRLCLIDLESAVPAAECEFCQCPDLDWKTQIAVRNASG